MKGLSVEYVAFAVILVVVIAVGLQIIKNLGEKDYQPKKVKYNVTFSCINLNNTEIDKDDLSDIIYGFLTEQCDDFYFQSKNRITLSDIERMVQIQDKKIKVIKIENCGFPSVNTGTFYVNFDVIEPGDKIYLNRKQIINSDILMCRV